MKRRISPVLLVLILIVLVAAAGIGTALIRRYMPSSEKMDGSEYFSLNDSSEAALVVNGELKEEKARIIDGRYYIADTVVGQYINGRFYWDAKNQVMLYTLPTEMFQISTDTTEYQTSQGVQSTDYVILRSEGDTFYLDLEFIQQYTDMDCQTYDDPARVVIRTEWKEETMVTAKKDTQIRQKGGIKSIIVDEVAKGDQLYLLDQMDNWSQVATEDGYTGYIRNEDISEASQVAFSHESSQPEYTSIHKDYKICLGWHQMTTADGNAALAELVAGAQGLNTISPTWFSIADNSGNITSLASADYVNQAHGMGLEVWGLIDNFSADADTLTVLSDTQARTNIINQLMAQADAVGLDGINVDFESITEEQGPHYIQFIRELSIACRNRGLVLSIDDPVPMPYSAHYDRREQGIVADYVINMGYDEHHSGDTEAGSVASLGFVRQSIEDSLQEVPAEKLINAIPFYTRLWKEPYGGGNLSSEVMGMDGASSFISENGMDVYWDSEAGQNVAMLDGEDGLYSMWVEDEQSIEEKMKLVQEYQLAGVAAWRLGFERDTVWPVIAQYLQ
ncbi:MAG TPA: SH3 domain-containing protein [Candidatus Pullilachnospira intestinigallinarum]|nr:SH3 domain-containing protein [Candidatus Pullilachnospira intestinigallinarum]